MAIPESQFEIPCIRDPSKNCNYPWREFNKYDLQKWARSPLLRNVFQRSGFPLNFSTLCEALLYPGNIYSEYIENFQAMSQAMVAHLQQIVTLRVDFIVREESRRAAHPLCPNVKPINTASEK